MPNHHDWERADLYAEENAKLRRELRQVHADSANIVLALDAAMQLIEALIMFLPDGQPLPPQLAGVKQRLDEAMLKLRGGAR